MHHAGSERWRQAAACALIAAAGCWAYANSFAAPFLFDDETAIVTNPSLHRLWQLWDALSAPEADTTVTRRPILALSFAVNYALGRLEVWGYHAGNVLIHVLAAWCLFGVVRRTLLTEGLRVRDGRSASWLALAIGLLWVVHPLNTEAVTYLSERAESLMGLGYLLTLYCAIRGWDSPRPARWHAAAIVTCALGMGTKEAMVTAPIMVVLYDRTGFEVAVRERWRRRWRLYTGLAVTWLILLGLVVGSPRLSSVRLGDAWLPAILRYAATQCSVVLHYLRLAIWPAPLVVDYGWPLASTIGAVLPHVMAVGLLLGAVGWALVRRRWSGFLGTWIFLILAPTSSLLPLREVAVERRMYLPLAAVITGVVVGLHALMARARLPIWTQRGLAVGLTAAAVIGLSALTLARNHDYRSEIALWQATVQQRPMNPRVHNNLGAALGRAGRLDEARPHLATSLQLDPAYAEAHYNLGELAWREGKPEEAAAHFREALRLRPNDWEAYRRFLRAAR